MASCTWARDPDFQVNWQPAAFHCFNTDFWSSELSSPLGTLSQLQCLIACSMIKRWMVGRAWEQGLVAGNGSELTSSGAFSAHV